MLSPRFVYNLRPATFNAPLVKALRPFGYLIAPDNATARLRALARAVRNDARALFVDNNNFARITKLSQAFATQAEDLAARLGQLEAQKMRSVRAADVPPALRAAFSDLARRVRGNVKQGNGDGAAVLRAQAELDPTHPIGAEDITVAAWLSVGVEPQYAGIPRRDFKRFNQAVARSAVRAMQALPVQLADGYYAVAPALSYDTAHDAGRVFADAGIAQVAMGFGAYMADDRSSDYLRLGRRELRFGMRLPNRYLRTAAVARGFFDGYTEASGRAPAAFHFLGLGAPIMMPIVTLRGRQTKSLSFDATSPIKDALLGGTIYVTKPAYLKIRTRKAALRLSAEATWRWDCPCPFCERFMAVHPFDYELGHQWFVRTRPTEVGVADLQPGGGLFDAYPLFSEPRGGDLRKDVDAARVGHNHWALEQILASLRRADRDRRLEPFVRARIDAYMPQTASQYAKAVELSLRIAAQGPRNV